MNSPLMSCINKDVLGVIMGVDPATITSLMQTCKTLLKLVKSHYSERHCMLANSSITLRFTQCILRDTFLAMKEGTILFQARKSFGKTISGYACMGKCGMVLITSNLMKVWLAEAKALGWYHADPERSRVICFKGVKRHTDYISNILSSDGSVMSNRSIILLVHDQRVHDGIKFMRKIDTTEPKVLVVDEAHVQRYAVSSAQNYCKWTNINEVFDKQLLLSANVMSTFVHGITGPFRMVSVKHLDKVPDIIWNIIPQKEGQNNWMEILANVIQQHGRVAVVATKEQLDSIEGFNNTTSRRKKNKEYQGAKIFYQKTGMDTIPKFNACNENCILLINTVQNTGINVLANALVIPDAGSTNTIRITQTVGRLVRTTNDVSDVEIYLCANDEQSYIRCHYARCYYNEDWKYLYETLPTLPYLKKCASIMCILGASFFNIDSVDGCVIFADASMIEDRQAVVDWWEAHHTKDTVLTKDIVMNLMCI
jgi:hypothetical protein